MSIKTRGKKINRKQLGFTLIEVMIALIILAVGLLALMTMQIVSIRANAFSSEMTYAGMLAQSRLEQIRNMSYDSVQTIADEIVSDATTKGVSYTVTRTVATDVPAANMKTVTLTINWTGSPAGSASGSTANFTTSFITVLTN